MKKKTILFMGLVAGFSLSAQNQKNISDEFRAPLGSARAHTQVEKNVNTPGNGYIQSPSAKGKVNSAVIWSEDFSDLSGWTTGGANSNLVMHDFDGPDSLLQFGWEALPSPTASNGFVVWDFYSRTPGWDFAANPAVGTLTSPVIDLGTDTGTYISFYQQLYWCCEIDWEAKLEVSTDGGVTFPKSIVLNKDFDRNERHWELGLGYYFTFRLTDFVKDDPTNVVLRFNWTGNQADQNDQYTNSYFWMLDDIEIHKVQDHHLRFAELSVPIQGNPDNTAPRHDIIYNTSGSGKQGIMQVDQIVPISFDSNVENFGAKTQTGVKLVVDILDNAGSLITSLESPSADLDPDDTLSFETLTTPSWTPMDTGNYRVVYTAVSDSSDQPGAIVPSDTFRIFVNPALHSLDFNRFNNAFGTNDLGDGSTVTNMMYFPSECELRSIDLRFSSSSVGGGEITIEVYDTAGFTQAAGFGSGAMISKTFSVTQEMIESAAPVTFDMSQNNEMLDINPGAYFFAITMYSNSGENPIQMANDQTFRQERASWMNVTEGSQQGWFTGYLNSLLFNAPWIRARLSPGIGLEENSIVNFAVYPNPSNGNIKLEIMEDGNYSIEVVNMTGKAVYHKEISIEAGGDHISSLELSHLPKGIYLLNVSGKKGSKAMKITLQ